MLPEDLDGEYLEPVVSEFNKEDRLVLYTEKEMPYPEGKLIVSRTDVNGFT